MSGFEMRLTLAVVVVGTDQEQAEDKRVIGAVGRSTGRQQSKDTQDAGDSG